MWSSLYKVIGGMHYMYALHVDFSRGVNELVQSSGDFSRGPAPSHLGWTSRLHNSHCDWASQFFLRIILL